MSPMRALLIVLALAACSKTPAAGTERGPCQGDHTCTGGLVCLSDLCVRPPAGDCAQVADAFASIQLGNYADKDKRGPVVADLRAKCTAEQLSVDDAKCLTSAKSKFEMSRCPHPILPELVELAQDKGGCKVVGARMEQLAKLEMSKDPNDPMAKMMPQLIEAVIASCNEDGWPDDVKGCIAGASDSDPSIAQRCVEKMPKPVQDKFMKRMQTIVEKAMDSGGPPIAPPPAPAPVAPPQ
jgi:hypothetical protein